MSADLLFCPTEVAFDNRGELRCSSSISRLRCLLLIDKRRGVFFLKFATTNRLCAIHETNGAIFVFRRALLIIARYIIRKRNTFPVKKHRVIADKRERGTCARMICMRAAAREACEGISSNAIHANIIKNTSVRLRILFFSFRKHTLRHMSQLCTYA